LIDSVCVRVDELTFSKILRTKSKDVIDECLFLFGCPPVIAVVNKRKVKFLTDYVKSCNTLCSTKRT